MDERYKIVFNGELKGRTEAEDVIEGLVTTFKLPETRARALVLDGTRRVIKKDLNEGYARHYLEILDKIGMVVQLEPMNRRTDELSLVPLDSKSVSVSGPKMSEGEPVFTSVFEPSRCLACGSMHVENGVCRDCGAARSEYTAGRTAAREGADRRGRSTAAATDPYVTPRANLRPKPREVRLRGPSGVPTSHGWTWIARGFGYFRTNPFAWILALIAFLGVNVLLALIPIIGVLLSGLLGAVFVAGFMFGAREQDLGRDFRVGHLFAGFREMPGSLVLVSLLYLVGNLLIAILIGILVGGLVFGSLLPFVAETGGTGSDMQDPVALLAALDPVILSALLVGVSLVIPLAMAFVFAPALVMLDGLGAIEAMKQSFMGCVKNILPLLVYGALALLLLILGTIPLGLGLLVVWPTLMAAIYAAYRDIYFE